MDDAPNRFLSWYGASMYRSSTFLLFICLRQQLERRDARSIFTGVVGRSYVEGDVGECYMGVMAMIDGDIDGCVNPSYDFTVGER